MLSAVMGLVLAAGAAESPPDLGWLAGSWVACGDAVVQESWLGSGDGMLVGANLTGGSPAAYEFYTIAANAAGTLVLTARPGTKDAVEFPLTTSDYGKAVFENPADDFPTSIAYWREGPGLRARIEGTMSGKLEHFEWTFVSNADGRLCNR